MDDQGFLGLLNDNDKSVLDNPFNFTFARHETFHPRWGWLKKGFEMSGIDSRIFLAEFAPVKLGVGKNMVRAGFARSAKRIASLLVQCLQNYQ